MSYQYEAHKAWLFTDDGQRLFLEIRDRVGRLIDASGAVTSGAAMRGASGDSWHMIACLDRLVELGELVELTGPNVWGQHRVFVRPAVYR